MPTDLAPLDDLKQRLAQLRQAWAGPWPGLPAVLEQALALMGWDPVEAGPDAQAMLRCAREAAALTEASAQRLDPRGEPQYHNRLHMADAILSLAMLLRAQRRCGPRDDDWTAALMLAVVAHDLLHPGGINRCAGELEQRSVAALLPILQAQSLAPAWQQAVGELILRTDPARVPANHQCVAGTRFQWSLDWACVLLNEADILASCLPEFGPALGQALADEWEVRGFGAQARQVGSSEGRRGFLAAALFSSPASAMLGLPGELAQQLRPGNQPLKP